MPQVRMRAKIRRRPMTKQQRDAALFCAFLGFGVWKWINRTAHEEQLRWLKLWLPDGYDS
jgi:hypothetical protein